MDATPPQQLRPPAGPDPAGAPAPPASPTGADGGAPAGPGGEGTGGGPLPLGVERTATGHGLVDALLERLGDADNLVADGHPEVYEDVHRGLREALAALDAHPRPGPPNDHRS
ncbi:hypothetical protein [Streptomyces roseolilacinus]|uniref:hypothetical protein n=1 Tax=Streptomyces roseolilacinus TaxID=66904 RepID=UPI00382D28CB